MVCDGGGERRRPTDKRGENFSQPLFLSSLDFLIVFSLPAALHSPHVPRTGRLLTLSRFFLVLLSSFSITRPLSNFCSSCLSHFFPPSSFPGFSFSIHVPLLHCTEVDPVPFCPPASHFPVYLSPASVSVSLPLHLSTSPSICLSLRLFISCFLSLHRSAVHEYRVAVCQSLEKSGRHTRMAGCQPRVCRQPQPVAHRVTFKCFSAKL